MAKHRKKPYGYELVLDLQDCHVPSFCRESLRAYFKCICKAIGMQREDLYFWDDENVPKEEQRKEPQVEGISAVQFIITSNITIHCLTQLKAVYVNIFSCKEFDEEIATMITIGWFGTQPYTTKLIERR